jgi:hypothetical protein
MFAREDPSASPGDAAARRRTIWLWSTSLLVAVAAWALVAAIRIPPAYTALPVQEVAPAAAVRTAGVALAGFAVLFWLTLLGRRKTEALKALAVILAAAAVGGGLALFGEAAPRVAQQSGLRLTVSQLKTDDQAILDDYAAGMRAIDPEARLSPFQLGRAGGLDQARKAVAEATALVARSRAAHDQALAKGRAELADSRYRDDLVREAQAGLEAAHGELATYWRLQGDYAALLQEMLALVERRTWRVQDASFVFTDPADANAHMDLRDRLATLSRAIDKDRAGRDETILP